MALDVVPAPLGALMLGPAWEAFTTGLKSWGFFVRMTQTFADKLIGQNSGEEIRLDVAAADHGHVDPRGG